MSCAAPRVLRSSSLTKASFVPSVLALTNLSLTYNDVDSPPAPTSRPLHHPIIYPPMHSSSHPCQTRPSSTRARRAICPLVPDMPFPLSCETCHPILSRHVNPILMYTSFLNAFLYASQDTTTTFLPRPASPIWICAGPARQ